MRQVRKVRLIGIYRSSICRNILRGQKPPSPGRKLATGRVKRNASETSIFRCIDIVRVERSDSCIQIRGRNRALPEGRLILLRNLQNNALLIRTHARTSCARGTARFSFTARNAGPRVARRTHVAFAFISRFFSYRRNIR